MRIYLEIDLETNERTVLNGMLHHQLSKVIPKAIKRYNKYVLKTELELKSTALIPENQIKNFISLDK